MFSKLKTINIPKDSIPDYLNWIKLQTTICFAALGSILFKHEGEAYLPIIASTMLFVVSMLSFLVSYISLVDQKSTQTPNISDNKTRGWIILSWVSFMLAFVFAIISAFFP